MAADVAADGFKGIHCLNGVISINERDSFREKLLHE